ncbi:MAG: hypothetical protein ACKVJK_01800 [Methylophagaceae bacterium]
MAIKISNTTIIDDSKAFINISNTSGIYGDLHASPSVTTSNISVSNAIQTCIMTSNQTFTMSGGAEGRTTALLLDTGTTPYVPTFPSSVKWLVAEPIWANARYWQITFLSRGTYFTASGSGFAGASPTEAVTLDGSTSFPIMNVDMLGINPLEMGWRFKPDGNVYKWQHPNNVAGNGETLYSTATWNNITPSQTYYIKASNYSGSVNLNVQNSSTLNSWIALSAGGPTREFNVYDTRTYGTYGDENCVMKIEISANSSGSPVLATGYYKVDYNGGA